MAHVFSPTEQCRTSTDPARAAWLADRRRAVVAWYDAGAPDYDTNEYPSATQRAWVSRLMARLAPNSLVLDAPCGTGKYFPLVIAAGHRVVGADQSAGMLAQASRRGMADALEHLSLHDLAYRQRFDAVLTIDAMENVPPEEWPLVLRNLHRAVPPGGLVYMTVEEIDEALIDSAFVALRDAGLPAVRGEVIEGDVAGYHYYPGRDQVLKWLTSAGLELVEEGFQQEEGWAYRHFLLRTVTD
jgi:cyclopropane fatty-acyl-phospholipid synthase-like methyltransferase